MATPVLRSCVSLAEVGLLNGLLSVINWGLSACENGVGSEWVPTCKQGRLPGWDEPQLPMAEQLEQFDLLLTGGRSATAGSIGSCELDARVSSVTCAGGRFDYCKVC